MIPMWNEKPPTLYSILESIVNYDKDEKTRIRNLAKESRTRIFDFDYELSNKVNKEKFECQILNHFIMRRIGFETFTAFQIQLEVKLNEIMPKYNKMFDMLSGWDIFKDGEKITRNVEDSRNTNTSATTDTESETTGNNISDIRSSDTPQDRIEEVQSGEYLSNYDYKQDNSESNDISHNSANSETTDFGNLTEITERTQNDKVNLYIEFTEKMQNIYSLIYKDLECLFYQLF